MNSSAKRNPKSAILMTVALLLSVPAMGQAQTAGEDDWSAIFVLYLLGPTLDGTVGIGPVGGDVDMSAGDVFSALDRAFLGIYAGEGERWGVVADRPASSGAKWATSSSLDSFQPPIACLNRPVCWPDSCIPTLRPISVSVAR